MHQNILGTVLFSRMKHSIHATNCIRFSHLCTMQIYRCLDPMCAFFFDLFNCGGVGQPTVSRHVFVPCLAATLLVLGQHGLGQQHFMQFHIKRNINDVYSHPHYRMNGCMFHIPLKFNFIDTGLKIFSATVYLKVCRVLWCFGSNRFWPIMKSRSVRKILRLGKNETYLR